MSIGVLTIFQLILDIPVRGILEVFSKVWKKDNLHKEQSQEQACLGIVMKKKAHCEFDTVRRQLYQARTVPSGLNRGRGSR